LLLCQAAAAADVDTARTTTTTTKYQYFFTPHPGYSISYEKNFFAQNGCSHNIILITPEMNLSTANVFSASNITLSQCSTTGGQSIAIGIPHIYMYGGNTCNDVFTQSNLIANVLNISQYNTEVNNLSHTKPFPYYVPSTALNDAGVPLDATTKVVKRLQDVLNKNKMEQ
jgi:hypothetical protein